MSSTLRIALLQMCSGTSVTENLAVVELAMQQAQAQNVQLLQLPENFAQMPERPSELHTELNGEGKVQDFLQTKSRQYGLNIVAGSLAIKETDGDEKAFARCLVYNQSGQRVAHYDKLHLYDVDLPNGKSYRESSTYQPGALSQNDALESALQPAIIRIADVNIGLTICYDLRFPELYRSLMSAGAELICVPSAFTHDTGKAHWQTLLAARAIENQVFVAAAAQVGVHANQRQTWGHSMVVDPWGDIVAEQKEGTGLIVSDLDLTKLTLLRESFPVLKHRRIL